MTVSQFFLNVNIPRVAYATSGNCHKEISRV